jgi:hypothetical protein
MKCWEYRCSRAASRARSTSHLLAVVAPLLAAGVARADNICAPAPVGVSGLTGAPDFWEQPQVTVGTADLAAPAGYGQELDDPRWTTAWRYDFGSGSGTAAGIRALEDDTGHFLYLSFLVYQDPNAFSTADQVYLGLSDGTHGDLVQISVAGTDPLAVFRNAPQPSERSWWGTADGGTTWTALQNGAGTNCTGGPTGPGPLCWIETNMLRVWSGAGTYAAAGSTSGTDNLGFAWVINARVDLTKVGFHLGLGGALPRTYRLFSEVRLAVPANLPIPYDWPPSSQLTFDGNGLPVSSVSGWGQASADMTTCAGTAVSAATIGLTPVVTGPSTTINVGPTNPANTFVAILSGVNGAAVPPAGSVKARFRMANCGAVGAGGTWNDLLPSPFFSGSNGTAPFGNDTIGWSCGGTTGVACPTFNSTTQSANQCLLVELTKAASQPQAFVQDSAWRSIAFAEPDAGSADAGDSGAPLEDAGSDATIAQDSGATIDSGGTEDSAGRSSDGAVIADASSSDVGGGEASARDAESDATVGQDSSAAADSGTAPDSAGVSSMDATLLPDSMEPNTSGGDALVADAVSDVTLGQQAPGPLADSGSSGDSGGGGAQLADADTSGTNVGGPLSDAASPSIGGRGGGCNIRASATPSEGTTFLVGLGIVAGLRLRRRRGRANHFLGLPVSHPSSRALKTARVRSRTPSLLKTLEAWFFTVPSDVPDAIAISRLLYPPAIMRKTSVSRGVSLSGHGDASKSEGCSAR